MNQEEKNVRNGVESRLIQSGEGRRFAVAGGIYTIKATGKDTGGAYAMIEMLVPPQSGSPLHLHTREAESFYILEGTLSFWLADQKRTGGVGCLVIAPPGLSHAFKNEGDMPARALPLITPAGLEKFFEEVGSPLEASAGPKEVSPEDLERVKATAPRYGVEVKLP